MRFLAVATTVSCVLLAATPASADCSGVNTSRVFGATHGLAYVRADVAGAPRGRAIARLFRSSEAGDVLVWTTTLINVPQTIWVDDGRRWVVTLGNYCDGTLDHALSVYDGQGELVADWSLKELVPDLQKHVTSFEVHTPWTSVAPLRFEASVDALRVIFPWGESKVVSQKPSPTLPG